MRKLGQLSVVLVAVFACLALVAASASAVVTTLLAEWLFNGSPVGSEQLSVESTGELLLEDKETSLGASDILCSGILDGWVSEDGTDQINEVLTLGGVAISTTSLTGTALECTTQKVCEEPLVWAVHLPWKTLLELLEVGGQEWFVILLTSGGSGNPGWDVECMKTILKPSDECTSPEAVIHLGLSGTTLQAEFSEAFTLTAEEKLASCTLSGKESGNVETEAGAPGTISVVGGGTLSASSEDNPVTEPGVYLEA